MSAKATIAVRAMAADILRDFDVAPQALIEARSLQQRIDRKYLLAANDIESLLTRLRQSHCVVRVAQQVWARYENIYFDTPDRELYHAHRRGRRPRYKVRIRHHTDRELSFLEVKRKDNSGRTVKRRLAVVFGQEELGSRERTFIEAHAPVDATRLFAPLSISFQRLTFVGRTIDERVTLDRELAVIAGIQAKQLGRVVIAEVKQSRSVSHAGAVAAFRDIHAREEAVSKYCLATILVAPVRANIFKPALRAVARLSS